MRSTHRWFVLAAAMALGLSPSLAIASPPARAPGGTASPRGGIPHEKIALDFLASHGFSGKSPSDIRFEDLLAGHFVTARVGVFEVYFPITALDKRGGDLTKCLSALLAAQEQILEWQKPLGRDQKSLRADIKIVGSWLKGLRPQVVEKCKECAGKNLAEALGAPEAVLAAAGRLTQSFGKGEALGLSHDSPVSVRVLLAPTRREFAELTCFVGWWNEAFRSNYWVDSISDWTTCWVDDIQVIALEYAAAGHLPEDYSSGEPLNKRDPDVMEQQVVQLSIQRLFEQFYGERVPAAFLGGLAMNLVIDQFGQINTRVDGDLRARSAGRREMFVPGGASGGGALGKNSAETRWRESHGKDRFAGVLRQSQKEGEGLDKAVKNRWVGFGIRSDKGGEIHVVAAPFLGTAAAEGKAPPEPFQGDFAEMLRGYKCAFIWWLQTKAASADKASREKFAQLIEKLADPSLEFESAFQAVYDNAALSDAEAGKDCLEGKFLLWLSKSK